MARTWPLKRLRLNPQQCSATADIVVHDDSDVELADPLDFLVSLRSDDRPSTAREGPPAAEAIAPGFQGKAASRLAEALQGQEAGNALAEELAAAFVKAWGLTPESAQRVRALLSALRSNSSFRMLVLERGSAGVSSLVTEDPRCWADEGLKAKREAWQREGLAEAAPSPQGGVERPCPECGGRALCETGSTAGFKLPKAYTQYRCMEMHCGKQTRIST